MDFESPKRKYSLKSRTPMIYPVIMTADGQIVDGLHRLDTTPDWPKITRPDINTPRKFFAARIVSNLRRTVEDEEIKENLLKLREAILKETNDPKSIIKEIVLDTGLEEPYVRKLLMETIPHKYMRTQEKKEKTVGIPPAEDEEKEEIITATQPPRESRAFQNLVEDTVTTLVGIPVDEMITRLNTMFDISREEAQDFVDRWKVTFPDLWSAVYDKDDQIRKAPSKDVTTSEELKQTERVAERPPSKLSFSRDELLNRALNWYPDEIVDRTWHVIEMESKKIPFYMSLFFVCWNEALKTNPIDELIQTAQERLL